MSRRSIRTIAAAAIVAVALLLAGCSVVQDVRDTLPWPFKGSAPTASVKPATPAPSKPSTRTPGPSAGSTRTAEASVTPAVSKTTSGTTVTVPQAAPAPKISSDIDGIELRTLTAQGALLVDLRPLGDFDKEHIEGAIHVGLGAFTKVAATWPKTRAVIVYDRTGAQSQSAQRWLEREGFTAVYHLFRGIEGYDDKLVGSDPTPIPPRLPVLYYFYTTGTLEDTLVGKDLASPADSISEANAFASQMKHDFDGRFEYQAYDVNTPEGLAQFIEFGGTKLPLFRLVTEKGQSEQYTGTGTFRTVRSHLERAIATYESETAQ